MVSTFFAVYFVFLKLNLTKLVFGLYRISSSLTWTFWILCCHFVVYVSVIAPLCVHWHFACILTLCKFHVNWHLNMALICSMALLICIHETSLIWHFLWWMQMTLWIDIWIWHLFVGWHFNLHTWKFPDMAISWCGLHRGTCTKFEYWAV